MKFIKEIVYETKGAFADYDQGTRLKAYLIGQSVDDTPTALIFHPATRGQCGSIEMGFKGKNDVYTSHNYEEYYINLDGPTEKHYRKMVENAGFEIPKNLLIKEVETASPKPKRKSPR